MRVKVNLGLLYVLPDAAGVVRDIFNIGEEAVEYLLAAGRYAHRSVPLSTMSDFVLEPSPKRPSMIAEECSGHVLVGIHRNVR